jgi:hypothetical protein
MAKIDISKIEGYENMTPEEKVTALEAIEYDDFSAEVEKYKNAASKANSEAAEWRKKHNALLSEEEQKKQADKEELENLRKENSELKREKEIASHKAKYVAMGYNEDLATETAEAMVDGDTEKVFANQKIFLETHDKNIKAELLGKTPKPPAGDGDDGVMTLEKLRGLSDKERYDYSVEHPEEYKQLYGGN